MVNTEDFSKRLEKIINYYDLSAASFADKINVGRSSISHILSGRNKPSLDFVLKVISTFPEVELYWLLNGKGSFPKSEESNSPTPLQAKQNSEAPTLLNPPKDNYRQSVISSNSSKKPIHKIVIFYKDGSFEAFENE